MNALLYEALNAFLGSAREPIRTENEVPDLDTLVSPTVFSFSPSQRLIHDLRRKGYKHFRYFAVLPSLSMPRWLLPIGDASQTLAGTRIYLPHKWTSRSIRQICAGMIKMGWNGWSGSRILMASKEPFPLETRVADVTGEPHPRFALSLGREPSVRKLTVQVMRPSGEILGYIKLPLTGAAIERVRHEAAVLERLWQFPALHPHIPRLLHAGMCSESFVLFQSPLPGEPGPTHLTEMHESFLRTLWSVNQTARPGLSLVDEVAANWDKAVPLLGPKWAELGQEALRRSAQELSQQTIRCGISHGDFTPWNTRAHEEKLLLFDWESTHWEAPTSWDIFHFSTQTAVCLNKGTESCLPADNGVAAYLLYLLNSVDQFLQEQNWTAIDHRQKLLLSELRGILDVRSDERSAKAKAVQSDESQIGFNPTSSASILRTALPRIVTTSWDDGDPRDIEVAELLHSRGLAGTFYIPMSGYLERATLTHSDLRNLSSAAFEIGAHSMSHRTLTHLNDKQLAHEVRTCKHTLEQLIGKEVPMFCYPNGRYNANVVRELKCAGYKGARTTQMLSTGAKFFPFEMPTTVQAFPHPRTGYLRDLGRARNILGLWMFTTQLSQLESWIDLGKKLFRQVLEHGGVWHLYGHSWEIEELALWRELREMLDYVSHRPGVIYLTNGELLSRGKLDNRGIE